MAKNALLTASNRGSKPWAGDDGFDSLRTRFSIFGESVVKTSLINVVVVDASMRRSGKQRACDGNQLLKKRKGRRVSDQFVPSPGLANFGVQPRDPGYIYLLGAGSRIKIGRSINRETRIKQARTWLPECEVIGVKPFWNHKNVEKYLQLGMARFWVTGEWYEFEGDEFEDLFLMEFRAFSEQDINRNSIDFIYFMNSTGMSEFTLEYSTRKSSKLGFQREETSHSSHRVPLVGGNSQENDP